MPLITPDVSGIVDGGTAAAANVTNPLNTITNLVNGQLDTSNFAANATNLTTIAQAVAFTTWVPVCTGFSSTPSTSNCRYIQLGKLVIAAIAISGTSNTTGFTFTAPVTVLTGYNLAGYYIQDNGTASVTGLIVANSGTTAVTVYTSAAGGGWTNSGTKILNGVFIYEAA